MPAHPHQLNQAIERTTLMTLETADEYNRYLDGDYRTNYQSRQANWDSHYESMRTAYRGHLMDLVGRGVPLQDMNIAILGPGLTPIGKDLGMTEQKVVLPKARSVVVADFSAWVVQQAHRQIGEQVNMRGKPLYPMQVDVTDCLSTAYAALIKKALDHLDSEDDLSEAAQGFAAWNMETLNEFLIAGVSELSEQAIERVQELESRMVIPDCFRGGGINKFHSFALSTAGDGEPLPISSWYLPMVLAGTGAAAEHTMWETFARITSDQERGARRNCEETDDGRRVMIRDFYQLIANYNTIVARKTILDILEDNPESQILAVSDVNTCLYPYDIGVLDRLHVGKLQQELSALGIEMTRLVNEWEWHDEATHHHGVVALQFRKVSKKRNGIHSAISTIPVTGSTDDGKLTVDDSSDAA